jgi:hypothetical protein
MKRSDLFFFLSLALAACALPQSTAERGDEDAADGEDVTAEAVLPSYGVNNKVLSLDGSADPGESIDSILTSSYPAIEPSGNQALTIEAWIHPTAVTGAFRQIVNNWVQVPKCSSVRS